MRLNSKLSRIDNATYQLTGHPCIVNWTKYYKFFKVYKDMVDDIVEMPFNELDLKQHLFRPLKYDPQNGYWK